MLRKIDPILAISLCCHAAAASASASNGGVELGETRYFKDWAAGCDNGLTCEAVALMPPGLPKGMLSLVVSRTPGSDGRLTVNIFNFDSDSDRYRLFVDGHLADTGAILDGAAPISVTGKDALKLVREIARGQKMRLVDGNGKALGRISLTGSAAALRYLDAQQGLARSPDALSAVGRRKAHPVAPILPVISAKRVIAAEAIPETQDLVALAESGQCKDERFGVTQDSAYSLGTQNGKAAALAIISCGSGAYNFGSVAYIGTRGAGGKWAFEPAQFDYRTDVTSESAKLKILINADWDADTQSLSSYHKSRGIGDCGQSADYVWDGEMFRLTHSRVMDECRGSLDWITVWRAKVQFHG